MIASILNRRSVCLALAAAILIAASASGEIPRKVNYQGKLTDAASGEAMAGSYGMVFRVYDQAVDGTQLWSESRTVQVDSAGIFSVILGEATPIDLSFDGPAWLQVEVGGEALLPRREIVSVPFAFHAMTATSAADCDSLGGVASDSVWTRINDGEYSGLDADKVDGLDALAFSDTGHVHDFRYVHRESLVTVGIVNNGSNPVDWTRLKGIPGGLADGVDDVGGSGDGHSLDAADGIPVDAVYVDNEGFVGIGTTSPSERLHLSGSAAGILLEAGISDPEIKFADPADQPSEIWKIYKDRGTGQLCFAQDGDRLAIGMDTGNVGIGAAAGGDRLSVGGSIDLTGHLKMNSHTVLSVDGESNTMLGMAAGENNTGSYNTFFGEAAGYNNSTGSRNVFLGDSTGYSNGVGYLNTFAGHAAGLANSRGIGNVFIGGRAGHDNGEGHWNTFVGQLAGWKNQDAGSNTFIGSGAGSGNVSGTDNTFLGEAAGLSNVTGSTNTCLGGWTGPYDSADGNVFIGYRAGILETGSNKLIIDNGMVMGGSLIYGDFASGSVGLGTQNPLGRLHISSPTPNYGILKIENSNPGENEATIGFRPGIDAAAADTWLAGYGPWGTDGFVIGKEGPIFVVNEWGNVGIGETYPTCRLEVKRGGTCWIEVDAAGGLGIAGIGLENDNLSWQVDLRGDMSDVLAFISYDFGVPTFTMAIEPTGDVGIGTMTPEHRLHVKGDAPRVLVESSSAGSPEVNFKHAGDPGTDVWAIYKHGDTDDLRFYQNGNRIWLKGGSGNMGVGGDPAGNKFYVNGTACGTSPWTTCSDRSLKRDIRGVTGALDKVMSLEGVSFLWRTDEYEKRNFDSGRHYGLIAQDVEAVLPEVVTEGAEGERAVAYAEIIPVLIEAIKAQQGRIEALEERLAEMDTQTSSE